MAKAKSKEPLEIEEVEEIAEVQEAPAFDVQAYMNELVPFYAFRDNEKYRDDLIVGVNGRIWRIKRGEQVMIPRKVYNVLMRSMEQNAKTADLIAGQANAYDAERRRWGD